jgi:histone acetyltransferase (RNA polymerase elongator complex component)
LIYVKTRVHPWIRLNRVIRDIPEEMILGGNKVVNLRQQLHVELKRRGLRCRCIRCREVRDRRRGTWCFKCLISTMSLKSQEYHSHRSLEIQRSNTNSII